MLKPINHIAGAICQKRHKVQNNRKRIEVKAVAADLNKPCMLAEIRHAPHHYGR